MGKCRRIEVKLLNKTMYAKLDFRKAYYATKQFKNFNSSDKERQLEEALTLGDPGERTAAGARSRLFPRGEGTLFRADFGEDSRLGRGADKEGRQADRGFRFHRPDPRCFRANWSAGVRDNITVKLNEADAAAIGRRDICNTIPC